MKSKKRVELKLFNNFNENSDNILTERFYNYLPTTKLNNSVGIKNATFPLNITSTEQYELNLKSSNIQSAEGIAYFKQYFSHNGTTTHRLLVYAGDNKIYINQLLDDTNHLFWLYNLSFSSAPITLSYKKDDSDAIILASKDEMKIWRTGYSPYTISNVPIITSMCMNEGVLFCTISEPAFKIWYATDLDAEHVGNIDKNSGYISLEDDLGYARKILTFDQSVYVFRDYGITKVNYIKGNISVNQIYLSNTKIYTDTVAICGNIILFLTKDGLHSFNGIKVSKINVNLNLFNFNCSNSVASSLGDKYYLALKIDFNDSNKILCEQADHVNNALIVFDVVDKSFEIVRGVDIKSLLPVKTEIFEKMLVTFNSGNKNMVGEVVNSSEFLDTALPKLWKSGDIVHGLNTKLFTKLSVVADKDVKFTLFYDDKEISFTTYQQGLNEFLFKLNCKQIKLEISSLNKSAQVAEIYLDYYEY